ncbi:MAG: hypothetical protein MUO38_10880, partial [Anaerolineales bacterium]|nr:hypothetical protein [Anaerolineales bacterium]
SDDFAATNPPSEIVTQVFKLNTVDPAKIAAVIKPLTTFHHPGKPLRETSAARQGQFLLYNLL